MMFIKRKLILIASLILYFSVGYSQSKTGTFTTGNKEFLLNGKPFVIRAAELHYSRIPKEYWEHRIQLCKAMGMNTVCIYLFWNIHEQNKDQFDFTGQNDVAAFVRLVQKNGMYCIVRPGPYVCAEWEMGGLPWWLLKKKDLKIRSLEDPFFVERTKVFFEKAGKQLAPLQIQNGGNIIMVQVENEYGTFGSNQAYMEMVRDNIRAAGFDKVQLFRCDWSSNFDKYKLDDVAVTLNFGAGADIDNQFKKLQQTYPNSPLMCSEYWTGWFDHWGKPHESRSISSFIGSLKTMMDRKISFSLYMAHGGTSFGQWGGANGGPYSPMVSSYDYDAPIGEQGNVTDKFFAIRNLLKNYLTEGEDLAEIPQPKKVIDIPEFVFKEYSPFFSNLPSPKTSISIQSMEDFNQGWGRILYRTSLKAASGKQKLKITSVHDWANVFINGKSIGKLDRRRGDLTLEIPEHNETATLDILVEATGRINYGREIIDRKGITEKVEIIDRDRSTELQNWKVYNFPVDFTSTNKIKYSKNSYSADSAGKKLGWYRSSFMLNETGDTFLDLSSWGKGMLWINGHNIGRFWKIGPQQTLFVPGVWLKKGANEIVILDVEGPIKASISGQIKPILDKISPDESLLHRLKNQNLNLSAENPISTGSFASSKGWKEVNFDKTYTGKYFCIEALNTFKENDALTTLAELELINEEGKAISSSLWKVIYADSEEITSANNDGYKVFDLQESTFWQTRSTGNRPKHPHQLVLDLGKLETIKGIRYLPRADNKTDGMIRDYKIYLKGQTFVF